MTDISKKSILKSRWAECVF